ncbi:MAG: hemolysin III family protein [Bacteroidales bacterium]
MMIKQTKEEIANTLTHFTGVCLAILSAWVLIAKSIESDWQTGFAVTIFCLSVFLMYLASTIYHWALPGKTKKILRYLDHINIYVLIAASYTPILLCSIGGKTGWFMFAFLWLVALAGSFYKIFFLGKYPRISLGIYLMMGWSVVFIARSVWENMPGMALFFILLEGIFYTAGTYFFSKDADHPYYHAIWHLFVLAGTIMHCAAVWLIL